MDVLLLAAVVEGEVLKEGVGRERRAEELRREEGAWVGEDSGSGTREEEGGRGEA